MSSSPEEKKKKGSKRGDEERERERERERGRKRETEEEVAKVLKSEMTYHHELMDEYRRNVDMNKLIF